MPESERSLPVAWDSDDPADADLLRSNAQRVLRSAVDHARNRQPPSIALAQAWHRDLYGGCRLPVEYYAGETRDSDEDFPELFGYEVEVAGLAGASSADVPRELDRFETAMAEAVGRLDSLVPPMTVPSEPGSFGSVITFAAVAHGEWVRIHPFANGNGRTARVWANWCLIRYGLPTVVRPRPRLEGLAYTAASRASMTGDHLPMVRLLNAQVAEAAANP